LNYSDFYHNFTSIKQL